MKTLADNLRLRFAMDMREAPPGNREAVDHYAEHG
jgi:hypothetical protein